MQCETESGCVPDWMQCPEILVRSKICGSLSSELEFSWPFCFSVHIRPFLSEIKQVSLAVDLTHDCDYHFQGSAD